MNNKIVFEKEYSINSSPFTINTNFERDFLSSEINEIGCIFSQNKIKTIKEYYQSFFKILSIEDDEINYQNILSSKMKINYLSHLKNSLECIKPFLLPYFKDVYPIRKSLLSKLKPLSFYNKILDIPVYSHDTKTGRSRIISGTNYMTMKKEKRSILRHSDRNRVLLEIDFNSCEPVFYFNFVKNLIVTNDLYETIKKDLNILEDRKLLKNAIISILYGAGHETVRRISKIDKNVYNKIKDYMLIDQFHEKVKISDKNTINNYYGRPIIIQNERNKVNYWVQSSVADFVYLSFEEFSNKIKSFELHGIIHDAMIFSVNKLDWEKIKNIQMLSEKISNFKIAVKISNLSDI